MTQALSFCFHTESFRPSVIAAVRSASVANAGTRVFVYCDAQSIARYRPFLPFAAFHDLAGFCGDLGTMQLDIAARRMRALALHLHGGWYLDAFDTLCLRKLPDVDRFTIGEECWDPRRRCTGACASPRGGAFVRDWLAEMRRIPEERWDHWTDQIVCNALLDRGSHPADALPTGSLNWPSESGFTGELRLSENQIAWLLENAWVVHYYGHGALGSPYKEMNLVQLSRCRELNGWLPTRILEHCEQGPGVSEVP
jgi:hypothetical protein